MFNESNAFPQNKKGSETGGPDADVLEPEAKNNYEKFSGLHDYMSGNIRVLDFILKKQGKQALLEEVRKNPLPTFQIYLESVKKEKPELYSMILRDVALNSHKDNNFVSDFNTFVKNLNKASSENEAEEAYTKFVEFFQKYSNSITDGIES